MDQEKFEEMGAAYVLGILTPNEVMEFERALANATPEQREVFEQMRMAARFLPVSGELTSPSPEVKSKIFTQIGDYAGDTTTEINVQAPAPGAGPLDKLKMLFNNVDSAGLEKIYRKLRFDQPLIALSVPLILFFFIAILYFAQNDVKEEYETKMALQEISLKTQTQELQNTRAKFADLENKIKEQETKMADLDKKMAENTQMVATKDKELADMKAASEKNQEMMELMQAADLKVADLRGLTPYPQGRAKVMFSPKMKMAYMHISNMPPPPANKDYQLWMMEGSKAVSAGVLTMNAGSSLVKVSAGLVVPVNRLSAFVVTLEPKGGVLKATGPAYLKGNVKL
jgi:anti-sigma-K factor RskA